MTNSAQESTFIKWFGVILAIINTALVCVYLVNLRQIISSAYTNGAEILWDMTVPWIRIRIAIALILAAICLLTRKPLAILGSAGLLVWALAEYARWVLIARETRLASGISQTGGMFGLEWWNMAVFALTMMLLLLVVRRIIMNVRQRTVA